MNAVWKVFASEGLPTNSGSWSAFDWPRRTNVVEMTDTFDECHAADTEVECLQMVQIWRQLSQNTDFSITAYRFLVSSSLELVTTQ